MKKALPAWPVYQNLLLQLLAALLTCANRQADHLSHDLVRFSNLTEPRPRQKVLHLQFILLFQDRQAEVGGEQAPRALQLPRGGDPFLIGGNEDVHERPQANLAGEVARCLRGRDDVVGRDGVGGVGEGDLDELSALGLKDASCDFGYALGVFHHIPDTERAMAACTAKLKPGAPFLVYLYHDLGDRRWYQRCLLRAVTAVRFVVARLPSKTRWLVTDVLAVVVYWPLARVARLVERSGRDPSFLPLFQYRDRSFYVMRNDALDRFGTRLEKRYSKEEVRDLLEGAGLENVVFSEGPPWWVAVAWRRTDEA